jgi:hypothetical protein
VRVNECTSLASPITTYAFRSYKSYKRVRNYFAFSSTTTASFSVIDAPFVTHASHHLWRKKLPVYFIIELRKCAKHNLVKFAFILCAG